MYCALGGILCVRAVFWVLGWCTVCWAVYLVLLFRGRETTISHRKKIITSREGNNYFAGRK